MTAAVVLPFVAKAALGLGASVAISAASGGFDKPKTPSSETKRTDRRIAVRSSTAPRRHVYGEIKVSGVLDYATTTNEGGRREHLHLVVVMAGHQCDSVSTYWLGDDVLGTVNADGLVISGKFDGDVQVRMQLGDQSAADPFLVSEVSEWPQTAVGYGITYLYAKLSYGNDGPERFPAGIPTPAVLLRGNNQIFDPRDGQAKYTSNPALCILDYLIGTTPTPSGVARPYGYGADYDTEINVASFIAAANTCQELVALPNDGGNQERYTCNGEFSRDEDRGEIMSRLLSTCDGRLTKVAGLWTLDVAVAETATRTALTVDDLRGDIKVTARRPYATGYNTVRGTFVSAANNWSVTEFPEVTEDTFVSEDNGEKLYRDLALDFTTNEFEAQRLAQIVLKRHRQGITVEWPGKLTLLDIAVWDVVPVTIADLGWTDKDFRVVTWELTTAGGVNLLLREEDPTVYDWDPDSVTEIDGAPDTDLPDPGFVPPPGIIGITEEKFVTAGGAESKIKVHMEISASPTPYILEYRPSHRLVTTPESEWIEGSRTRDLCIDIYNTEPGPTEFRVIGVNGIGAKSEPALFRKELIGLLDIPSDIESFWYTQNGDTALLRWPQRPEIDVQFGGLIRIRHSDLTAAATWTDSRPIIDPVPGKETEATAPALTGTYLAKAEDSSGLQSTNAIGIAVNADGALYWKDIVGDQDEHTTFPGTKVDVEVVTGELQLSSGDQVDDWGLIDTIVDIDLEGGMLAKTSGTYTWDANPVDLTTVHQCRVTVTVHNETVGGSDNIDDRGAPIDEWLDFDGASGLAYADVVNFIRWTIDDPAGSPSWSDWQRIERSEFNARAFELKSELSTEDPEYNVHIDFLRAEFEEIDGASLP